MASNVTAFDGAPRGAPRGASGGVFGGFLRVSANCVFVYVGVFGDAIVSTSGVEFGALADDVFVVPSILIGVLADTLDAYVIVSSYVGGGDVSSFSSSSSSSSFSSSFSLLPFLRLLHLFLLHPSFIFSSSLSFQLSSSLLRDCLSFMSFLYVLYVYPLCFSFLSCTGSAKKSELFC